MWTQVHNYARVGTDESNQTERDRQTGRQTDIHTHIQRETERDGEGGRGAQKLKKELRT